MNNNVLHNTGVDCITLLRSNVIQSSQKLSIDIYIASLYVHLIPFHLQ